MAPYEETLSDILFKGDVRRGEQKEMQNAGKEVVVVVVGRGGGGGGLLIKRARACKRWQPSKREKGRGKKVG